MLGIIFEYPRIGNSSVTLFAFSAFAGILCGIIWFAVGVVDFAKRLWVVAISFCDGASPSMSIDAQLNCKYAGPKTARGRVWPKRSVNAVVFAESRLRFRTVKQIRASNICPA